MAKKSEEDRPKGSPAWMSTYGDMVTLLLTFFIMMFAMSSIDSEKVKMAMNSLQGSVGVLDKGSSLKADGTLIGSGVLPLPQYEKIMAQNGPDIDIYQKKQEEVETMKGSIEKVFYGKAKKSESNEDNVADRVISSIMQNTNLIGVADKNSIKEALGSDLAKVKLNGKSMQDLVANLSLEEIASDKGVKDLFGTSAVEKLLKTSGSDISSKTLKDLVSKEQLKKVTVDDLTGGKTFEELFGMSELENMTDSKTVARLIAGMTPDDLLGDQTVDELISSKDIANLSGAKIVSEVLGNKTLEELVGDMTAKELIGDNELKKMLESKTTSDVVGDKKVEDFVQKKEINKLIKNKAKASQISGMKASDLIGDKSLNDLVNNVENDANGYDTASIAEELKDKVSITTGDGYVKITFQNSVLFDSGSAKLKSSAYEVLGKLYSTLKGFESSHQILIEGHTDNVPINTSRYPNNWYLSSDRALAVLSYYVQKGISPYSISATGYGEFYPVADNNSVDGRAKNRRVEIKIMSKYTDSGRK